MRRLKGFAAGAVVLVALTSGATASALSDAPAGVTAIALDGRVELAWQPTAGGSAYAVYRGDSPSSITEQLTPAGGITATSYVDATAPNGVTKYYSVRAVGGGAESGIGIIKAQPTARSCASGNPVVLENCFRGNASWRVVSPAAVSAGGIEGYATANSINRGESVGLKINTGSGAPYRIEIYRSGYYGGDGARLISTISGLSGTRQASCTNDAATGLYDCAGWSVSATITTTTSWPTGVYLLRLVREDNGADNHILLAVRDDARTSDLLYAVPFSSYEAYNNYGGKSLYEFNSSGGNTAAGTIRAVKVSFDRPFDQARSTLYDWYTRADYALVYWLERQGYDVAYTANTDFEHQGAQVRNHTAFVSAAHDEYYSSAMRAALEQARDAGVSLFFSGSNEVYWRIRFEAGPTGQADRVLACYKETKGGGADPSGPTSTWRDPARANRPENALLGVQYLGDKFDVFYPLVVSAAEGKDRVYRYTALQNQAAGSSTAIGQSLVGWEWDGRVANGAEPAGVKTLASSPVSGNIEQNYGAGYETGPAVSTAVKYTAPSGALVFATGTNHWSRGLAYNADGVGEPDLRIQQVTTNVFADMNVLPATPSADLRFDSAAKPPAPASVGATAASTTSITVSWSPIEGADGYHVFRSTSARVNGQPLGARANGALVTGTTFTDTALDAGTTYYYVVETVAGAVVSAPSVEASATTVALPAPTVTSSVPADGAVGVNPAAAVRATFSRAMDGASITNASYTLSTAGGVGVGAAVTYDSVAKTAVLTPTAALAFGTTYTAKVDATARASDGTHMAGAATWTFTTAAEPPPAPTIVSTTPVSAATDVPRNSPLTVSFSRAMDGSTITTTSFTLRNAAGALVGATVAYDATTKSATLAPSDALASGATYTATVSATVQSADGTPLAAPYAWTFSTAACPCRLFTTQLPALQSAGSFEVGVKIKVDQPLALTSMRFYKSSQETGAHTGTVWTAAGTRLLSVPFTNETASGWQQQAFPTPLQLQANTVYVLSVNANTRYVATNSGLQTAINVGPLHSVADGKNGVYNDTRGSFPSSSYGSSNYFVDAEVASVSVPFGATELAPAGGATGVGLRPTVRATFSKAADATTINASTFTLEGPTGAVPATVAFDAVTNTATLQPSGRLASGLSYTARLSADVRAGDGSPLSGGVTWSFTTAACPCSLFSSVEQPSVVANGNFELGVKVRVDEALAVTSIRYYKAAGETGSHVGSVWNAAGALLARVGFSGETASGWQSQALPTPLQLQPGAVYVLSVNANTRYGARPGGLQNEVESGPFHSVQDAANGVYNDTPALFPSQSYNSTNYYVDAVVERSSAQQLGVTSTTPAAGAGEVPVGTTVQATFSTPLDSATLTGSSFTLRDAAGSAIPATVSYDGSSGTATLTPSSGLAWGRTYTATLAGTIASAGGTTLGAAYTWQFTTAACPCSLFSSVLQPALFASGTFELGVKLTSSQPLTLTAVRFFKSAQETGAHTATVWSSNGVPLTSVAFASETASGWQRQVLATPLQLQAGTTYIVSVNVNASYAVTPAGLQTQVAAGPLRTVADGANGVYADAGGTFPTQSYNSSNYFVDVEVRP